MAVISGKATPDGRCLLCKNRDTSVVANKMAYLQGEKFGFIALIDAKDTKFDNAWAGINSEGFAIMNSALTNNMRTVSYQNQPFAGNCNIGFFQQWIVFIDDIIFVFIFCFAYDIPCLIEFNRTLFKIRCI